MRAKFADLVVRDIPRIYLAVNAGLADAAGDQLRVLTAEIQDQYALGVDIRLPGGVGSRCGHRCYPFSRPGNSGLPW